MGTTTSRPRQGSWVLYPRSGTAADAIYPEPLPVPEAFETACLGMTVWNEKRVGNDPRTMYERASPEGTERRRANPSLLASLFVAPQDARVGADAIGCRESMRCDAMRCL